MTQIAYSEKYTSSTDYGSQSYLYKLEITEESRNIANNTVSVKVDFYVRPLKSYYRQMTDRDAAFTISTDNNETFNNDANLRLQKSADSYNTDFLLSSWSGNLTAKADGSLTITAAVKYGWRVGETNYRSYAPLETTVESSGNIVAIPRATTPTFTTPFDLGSSITINTPRASSSFTHKLEYTFGSASGVIAENVATSANWNVPLSLANQIPNSTSGVGNVICKTYNGSQLIGTKSVPFTAKVPASVVPNINSVNISEAVSGLASKFGGFVQNKSKLKVITDASGAYGSAITKYQTTIQSTNYLGSDITSNIVTASGTIAVTSKVTDSRGRVKQTSNNIEVLPYFLPKINSFSAFRCNADGSDNDEGTRLNIAINFAIAPVNNKNDKSYKVLYKKKSDSYYTTLIGGNVYSRNDNFVSESLFNVDNSYDLQLKIWDYFGSETNSIKVTLDIPTAFTLIDYHSSGKGLSIGKVAEQADLVDVDMNVKFRRNIDGLKTINGNSIVGNGNISIEGITDYPDLVNKPKINNVELVGNKTSANLGLAAASHTHTQSQVTDLGINNFVFNNNRGIYAKDNNGTAREILKMYTNNNMVVGAGVKAAEANTFIDGKVILLRNDYNELWFEWNSFISKSNQINLGTVANPWRRAYCTQAMYVTSDERNKKYINNLDTKYENLFHKLNPKRFKFKIDTVDDNKWHMGFIAQEVEQAVNESGLSDMSLFERSFYEENGEQVDRYVLAYDEFIALNTHMIQKLYKVVEMQQNKINELEQRIIELEEVINAG